MTQGYRRELFSRIAKLNFTNRIQIKRYILAIGFSALFILIGILLFLPVSNKSELRIPIIHHMCGFYKNLSFIDCIRSTVSFAAPDVVAIFIIFFFGYTMLSKTFGSIILAFWCIRVGFCTSCLYSSLIEEPIISNGSSAFSFFCICKIIVLISLIFSFLSSESFSYRYCDMYGKHHNPFTSAASLQNLATATSISGFAVLINTIYLIFQSLQNYSLL